MTTPGLLITVLLVTAAPEQVLLNIAAHPDDEDGPVLLYHRDRNVRTSIIVATRGEGGQNATGDEMGTDLGVIRSREMEDAATILESDLYFLNLPDFGYSKTAEETLRIWDRDVALERLVRLIREIAPDVIVTNHDIDRGHGHHRALAMLTLEAFRIAGNPEIYPETPPHQPRRLFIRTDAPSDTTFSVPVDSHRDEAWKALLAHKTQGPWEPFRERWESFGAHYRLAASVQDVPDPGEGLFRNIPDRPEWTENLWEAEEAETLFEKGGIPLLAEAASRLAASEARWARRHAEDLEKALWRSLDIITDVRTKPDHASPGETVEARLVLQNAGTQTILIEGAECRIDGMKKEATSPGTLPPGARCSLVFRFDLPEDIPPTIPIAGSLHLRDRVEPIVRFRLGYSILGHTLGHAWESDLVVRPPFSIRLVPDRLIHPRFARVRITNRTEKEATRILRVEDRDLDVVLPPGASDHLVPVFLPADLARGEYPLRASLERWETEGTLVVADLRILPDRKILVLEGAERTVSELLKSFENLEIATDPPEDLSSFDAIVIGPRAGEGGIDDRLESYVREGGHLVVLYHRNEVPFAPYPLPISRDRVTDENAEVTHLLPGHPILTRPNKITPRDWKGWVQERGLYFPKGYAEQYEEIVSMADPGEDPLKAGILFARYGQGTYVYTSLGLHRQIRSAHPGAARLLLNLVFAFPREKKG